MEKKNPKDTSNNNRSLSRLAAVQLLYKKNFDNMPSNEAIYEFKKFNFDTLYEDKIKNIDQDFFEDLVSSFYESSDSIDELVSCSLKNNSINRLELVLAAIIRLAACELLVFVETPARVIINEYVNLAHAFFDDQQPNLANGVIDGLARKIREKEFN